VFARNLHSSLEGKAENESVILGEGPTEATLYFGRNRYSFDPTPIDATGEICREGPGGTDCDTIRLFPAPGSFYISMSSDPQAVRGTVYREEIDIGSSGPGSGTFTLTVPQDVAPGIRVKVDPTEVNLGPHRPSDAFRVELDIDASATLGPVVVPITVSGPTGTQTFPVTFTIVDPS
jgi:hypothetical protein